MSLVVENGFFAFSKSAIDGCNWLMYKGRKIEKAEMHYVGLDVNSSYKIGEILFRSPTGGTSWQLYCTLMLCTSLDGVWAEIIWKLLDPWSDSGARWQEFKMTSQTFNDEWTFEYMQIGKSFKVNVVLDNGHNSTYWTDTETLKKATMQGTLPPFL